MNVYIHPAAMSLRNVFLLQKRTGRTAVVSGKRVELVLPKRQQQPQAQAPEHPYGGDAA